MVGPNKKFVIITLLILIIHSIFEAIFTFGIIGITADYFSTSNQLPEIFDLVLSRAIYIVNQSIDISKDLLLLSFLFISLILRQSLIGIQNTFIHLMNTRLTANIRVNVMKNEFDSLKKNQSPSKHGSVEQIISQDSKMTGQTIVLFFHFINSLFFISCMAVMMFYISKNLFILSLLFSLIFLPYKFLYSKLIVKLANRSKSLEYNIMNSLSQILGTNNFKKSENQFNFTKIRKNIHSTSQKEAMFRIMMSWDASIIQLVGVLFFILILYLALTFQLSNLTQILAFFFIVYRILPFITKASKHLNSFFARKELVFRTHNSYTNSI